MPRKRRDRTANGGGTIEWRNGKRYARISLPSGGRKRVLLDPKLSEAKARETAASIAERVREGRIVFDPPRPRGQIVSSGPLVTVRDVLKSWTGGELLKRFGSVNGLRTIASARIVAWTLEKHAMKVHTRGPSKPAFGNLPIVDVKTDDITAIMAAHAKGRAQTKQHTYNRLFSAHIELIHSRPWRRSSPAAHCQWAAARS